MPARPERPALRSPAAASKSFTTYGFGPTLATMTGLGGSRAASRPGLGRTGRLLVHVPNPDREIHQIGAGHLLDAPCGRLHCH